MPPIDFFIMTSLLMDGTPPPSTNEADVELVMRCIGPQLVEYYKSTRGVLALWFEKNYMWATNQSTPAEMDFSSRTFLIYMLTHFFFCGKSDQVYFHLLSAIENLDMVDTYSWGRYALRWMYANINEISAEQGPHAFLGLCIKWEV